MTNDAKRMVVTVEDLLFLKPPVEMSRTSFLDAFVSEIVIWILCEPPVPCLKAEDLIDVLSRVLRHT